MQTKDKVLGIRLTEEDVAAFDALVAQLPYANRAEVARDAFRRGMASIRDDIKPKRK